MRFFRKLLFGAAHDDDYRPDYTGRNKLADAWAAMSKPEHHAPHGIVTLPYGDPDCDRLIALYRRINQDYPIEWARDALDIAYDEEFVQAPLVEVVAANQVELSRKELERTTVVREADDGRSFLEQTDAFPLKLKYWKYDCGYIECDGLPVGLLFSTRLCELLRRHGADMTCRAVIDLRTGEASIDFCQVDINAKIPIDESYSLLIREAHPHGDAHLYPGIFMNFYEDIRERDLYFRPELYHGEPIFLSEQYLGVGKWLNDSRRCLVISSALRRDIEKLRRSGMALTPAYFVDARVPPSIWGGTMVFGQDKYADGGYADWFEAKLQALERILGPADRDILSARVPLHLGGESSVFIFRHAPFANGGIAYVTSDLIGMRKQRRNRLGQYELMMCTRRESAGAPELLGKLAKYTLDEALEPGETMDIGPAMPEDSTISALLFVEPRIADGGESFEVRGVKAGVLLCIGITARELEAIRRHGATGILERLKAAGVFPFTEVRRRDVDLGLSQA